jgi:2-amino-4-hydroxy-6-hydroxymethyldihydropteridine diphosphokinase
MAIVYLGLGSNIGNRRENLRAAIAALETVGTVEAQSRIYETAPLYVLDQPRFLNMAARLCTDLAPRPLLGRLKDIERALGRTAGRRYGPRLIDIDILLYDALAWDEADLTIPHPRLCERYFALAPLADIGNGVVHPVEERSVGAILAALPTADAEVVADTLDQAAP